MMKPTKHTSSSEELPVASVQIRLAQASDADVVAVLVLELLEELASPEDSGYSLSRVATTAKAVLDPGCPCWAFLAYASDEHVGVITLSECAAIYAGGRFGEIAEFYVRPRFRSAGVGQQLIGAAVAFARRQSWTRLEVGAPLGPRWNRTVEFYRQAGFKEVGPRLKRELAHDDSGRRA